jgi:hypothetical protein
MHRSTKTGPARASCPSLLDALERALKTGVQTFVDELRRQFAGSEAEAQPGDVTASPSHVDQLTISDRPRSSGANPIQSESWWLEICNGDGGTPTRKEISKAETLKLTKATDVDFILNGATEAAYLRGREEPMAAPALLTVLDLFCTYAGDILSRERITHAIPGLSGREEKFVNNRIQQYLHRLRDGNQGLGEELYNRIVEKARGKKLWIRWKGFSFKRIRRSESDKCPYSSRGTGFPSEDQ